MKYEVSCGAIVYTKIDDVIYYVIVESLEGIYGFPKGHVELNETEKETALREIFEETGLKPNIIDGFRLVDEHIIPTKENVMKRIVYFVAEYKNQEIKYQKEELLSASLMTFDEAISKFQYDNTKRILESAKDFINRI